MIDSGFPKRAIHLDFHTMPSAYDLGEGFDPEEFAWTLHEAHVDYITVFAHCNIGFAYYPTTIGTVHPALKTDMLGGMVEACHKLGIKVTAYFNAGLDQDHAADHREWCKVDQQGKVINIAEMSNFNRQMCRNTSYREHLISMIDEMVDNYSIDGLFLDCFTNTPCYGSECLDRMRALGMDVKDPAQVTQYAIMANHEFCDEVTRNVRDRVGDSIFLFYNGMPYRSQPTHLEIEVLPTGGWGYDFLPFAIRYARSLNKPYFTMTGRFLRDWGDFGGLRTVPSLAYDHYYSLANGGTCSVGDHLHPVGKLTSAVYDLIGSVYSEVEKLEEWTYESKPQADILVLEPWLGDKWIPADWSPQIDSGGWDSINTIKGVSRMLSELKQQFDITDGSVDFSAYKVLVLPDATTLTDDLRIRVKAFLDSGGSVVCSGYGGFVTDRTKFTLAPESVIYQGKEPFSPIYFTVEPEVSEGVPDMPAAVYLQGAAVQAGDDTQVLASVIQPYDNFGKWDWNHEYFYTPPEKQTGRPAVVQTGNIIYISFPIFAGYYAYAVPAHKTLFKNLLTRLLPDPLIKVTGMPSFGQVTTAYSKQGDRLVHLLCYCPETRGMAQVIEEPICLRNVEVQLKKDEKTITRAYLAPSRESIPFTDEGEYLSVIVPEVNGYQMVVFEKEASDFRP